MVSYLVFKSPGINQEGSHFLDDSEMLSTPSDNWISYLAGEFCLHSLRRDIPDTRSIFIVLDKVMG